MIFNDTEIKKSLSLRNHHGILSKLIIFINVKRHLKNMVRSMYSRRHLFLFVFSTVVFSSYILL